MQFLQHIKLIQGGMGVYVSNWRLAKAVAMERPGEVAGTVSGTALDVVYVRLLQLGDPGGHARRALDALDTQFATDVGRRICDRYFIEGGKAPQALFRSAPMQMVRSEDGRTTFAAPNGEQGPIPLRLDETIIELLIATGFAEVWLAKEGHQGKIFINFLNKIELPLIYIMYGAMLAGVDGIIVGAGNPEGLPAICARLANHEAVTRSLAVLYAAPGVCAGAITATSFPGDRIAGGTGCGTRRQRYDGPRWLHYRASHGRRPQCQPHGSAEKRRQRPAHLWHG